MPKPKPLPPKILRFVTEYTKDWNATQAAIRAGYSPKTAKQQGSALLTRLDVKKQLQAARARRMKAAAKGLEVADITADRIYLETARLAFSDVRRLYNEHGHLLPVHEWPDDVAASVIGVETVDQNLVAGDGVIDRVHKVRRADKVAALKLLAQAKGMLTEQVEHKGEITYKWKD